MGGESAEAGTRTSGGGRRKRAANRAFILGAIAAVALIVPLAAIPPSTTAAAVGPAPAPPAPLGFELRGSGGYPVEVYGEAAREGLPAQVLVRVATHSGAVTYRFPAAVEAGSIQADLGRYGQISVVFRATSGGFSVAESGCDTSLSAAAGDYEGTISFHPTGSTAVEATRAEGSDALALDVLCAEESGARARPPGTYLDLSGGPNDLNLTALRRGRGGVVQIQATIAESREGIGIERSVEVAVSDRAFDPHGLRSARLDPPAPFSGSATFRRRAGVRTWQGNLRVDFPGRPDVALTGRGVRAQLSHGRVPADAP